MARLTQLSFQAADAGDRHLNTLAYDGTAVVTGTYPGGEIWRSTDGGLTWANVGRPAGDAAVDDIMFIKAAAPGTFLAGCSMSGAGSALYRSTDSGSTWTKVIQFSAAESTEGLSVETIGASIVLLAGGQAHYQGGIWRSDDGGTTFESVFAVEEAAAIVRQIRHLGGGVVIAGVYRPIPTNRLDVMRSTDNGRTWSLARSFASTDVYAALVLATGVVYLGSHPDGVVYRSDDLGRTFTVAGALGVGTSVVMGLTLTPQGQILAFVNQDTNAASKVYMAESDGQPFVEIGDLSNTYHYHEPLFVGGRLVAAAAYNSLASGTGGMFAYAWQPPESSTAAVTHDFIEAWVTDPAGTYIAHLDRSQASPFRRFAFQRELNAPGVGSLEYHLDNALVSEHDDLFAYENLVWMRFRGQTFTWVIEDRRSALDEQENATDWVQVSGRGTLVLAGSDRRIWPTHYSDATADPTQWQPGGWTTKTTASAALGQRVVPVVSTTVGEGATVGDAVEIVGGGNRQVGIIESIVAGVSITLVDNLAYTFRKGSRVRSAASQWRRFVNRAAGEMLWDLIAESNPRAAAISGAVILRGTIESTGADGWTQDFRFDDQGEVITAVTNVYGDVEMDGLTFSYRNSQGTDRSASVILEEGADLLRLALDDSDRDTLGWVVAEGTGHAVFSYLAPKKKTVRSKRKTARRVLTGTLNRRKAPAAKRSVVEVKVDYAIDYASEATSTRRLREAYIDAKDVSSPDQLDAIADAALEEHQVTEAVGLEVVETRYRAFDDFGMGDWIRVISPRLGADEDVRIVSISVAEDDSERIRVALDVNTRRSDHMLRMAQGAKDTRSSLGVQNRQPQGQLVPFSFAGADVFDDTDTMDVLIYVPDRMRLITDVRAFLRFREFFASAKTAAASGTLTSDSGGGATSGSSSASTSGEEGSHDHGFALVGTAGAFTSRRYAGRTGAGGSNDLNLSTEVNDAVWTTVNENHSHGMAHTHSTPNHQHTTPTHTHGLTYGVYKEAYPASHSVTLKVYEWDDDATWTLVATVSGITEDVSDQDLSAYITGAGVWRLELKSAAAQPNGGRLGCDVGGYVLGAIQAE